MAEGTGDPSPEPDPDEFRRRLQEFVASGKAAKYVEEGFGEAAQGGFLDLQGFKERESRR